MNPTKLYQLADNILTKSFYLLLFTVPLIFLPFNSELFEFNKMLLTYALTTIITAAWAIKSIAVGKPIFRRTPLDIFLLIFLVSQFFSFLVSIDPHTSLFGYYSRSHGGLLSTITYAMLYWAFVSNMNRKTTLSSILYLLSSATVVATWGILEHFGASPSCLVLRGNLGVDCWVQDVQNRVFATLGQPNWMAAWLVALSPIAWAIAISKIKNQNENIHIKDKKFLLWLVLSALFFLALLYTKSRSGLLGFAAAYGVFWAGIFVVAKFSAAKRSQALLTTKSFLIFTLLFLILGLAAGTPWTPSVREFLTTHNSQLHPAPNGRGKQPTAHISQLTTSLETGGTESGEIRRIVWKGATRAWRAYPLFGSGLETFAYVYYNFRPVEHNLTSEWDFLYNKAHNEYLNFLATTGALGLATYLLVIGASLYIFLKLKTQMSNVKATTKNSKPSTQKLLDLSFGFELCVLRFAFLAGYTSILVTNFFGFSVVPVAILFFLFPAMGLVVSQKTTEHLTPRNSRFVIRNSLFIIFVLLFALARIGALWYADVLYARAQEQTKAGQVGQAMENAQKAIKLRAGEPNYWSELAQARAITAASLSLENEAAQAAELAELSLEASNTALSISPRNVSLLKSRAVIANTLSVVDRKYLLIGIEALEKATSLAPTEPKIHYNLGVLYSRAQDKEGARRLLQKALELKPDYEDPKEALETLREE